MGHALPLYNLFFSLVDRSFYDGPFLFSPSIFVLVLHLVMYTAHKKTSITCKEEEQRLINRQ